MGYRSNVALCLDKPALNVLENRLDLDPVAKSAFQELTSCADHFTDAATSNEMWYWRDIKWYADYPEIAFLNQFLDELDYLEYYFIRIGDDVDDTEIRGNYWENPFDLYVSRKIGFTERV